MQNKEITDWHELTINSRSKLIELYLTLSVASMGFVISQFLQKSSLMQDKCGIRFLFTGSIFLLFTIIFLVIISHIRVTFFNNIAKEEKRNKHDVEAFKLRASNVKTNGCIKTLIKLAVLLFLIGEFALIAGFFKIIAHSYL